MATTFPTPAGPRPPDATAAPLSPARLALPGMALIGVCYGLARFAYGLFVPEFRAEFALGADALGAIGAGSYAGYCLAIVASFLATHRFGPRPVAITAGVLASAGTAMVAAATHPLVLAAGVLIAGASTGVASPPLAAAVARWIAQRHQDRIQTVINAGTGLGVLLAGPVSLAAASAGHWRLAWAGFALVAVAVTGWVAATTPSARSAGAAAAVTPAAPGATAVPAEAAPVRGVPPGTATMVISATLMGAASAAVWIFGTDLVVSHGGVSSTAAAWLWVLLGVAGLAGAVVGDLVGRVGLGRAWRVLMLALAAATATVGLVPQLWPAVLAAVAGFGATYIALTGALLVWGTRVYGHRPATGVGVAFLAIAVGQILGSLASGAVAAALAPAAPFAGAAALAVLGSLLRPARVR